MAMREIGEDLLLGTSAWGHLSGSSWTSSLITCRLLTFDTKIDRYKVSMDPSMLRIEEENACLQILVEVVLPHSALPLR